MKTFPALKSGPTPFHTRHSLLMLVLLLTALLVFCFLLVQNQRLKSETGQKVLEQSFRERVNAIDGLLGNIRSSVRALQLSAEADIAVRVLGQPQSSPIAFGSLRDNPDGSYFHLDSYQPPLTEMMVGNLTGRGSIRGRSPDFYREVHMALELNHRFRAIAETLPNLAWLYYLSDNDFVNVFPWQPANHFRFSPQLKEQEFFRLGPDRNKTLSTAPSDPGHPRTGMYRQPLVRLHLLRRQTLLAPLPSMVTIETLSALVRDFEQNQRSLMICNSKSAVAAHPTLHFDAARQFHSLDQARPEQLRKLATTLESLLSMHPASKAPGW
ncbi:MAG: hypothetical protein R2864_02240 [Syntrophotaleaceae bacterium]